MRRFLLATAALSLASCGSDGGGDGAGTPSIPVITPAPTPTPTPTPAPTPTPSPTPTPTPTAYETAFDFSRVRTISVTGLVSVVCVICSVDGPPLPVTKVTTDNGIFSYNPTNSLDYVSWKTGSFPQDSFDNVTNAYTAPSTDSYYFSLGNCCTYRMVFNRIPGLNYVMAAFYQRDPTRNTFEENFYSAGSQTSAADIGTGTLTYNMTYWAYDTPAAARAYQRPPVFVTQSVQGGTFSINVDAKSVSGTLIVQLENDPLPLTLTMTGAFDPGTGRFNGTATNNKGLPNWPFAGAVYGPRAGEIGFAFAAAALSTEYRGDAFGKRSN